MNPREAQTATSRHGVDTPVPHTLHECRTAEEFRRRFEERTGRPIQSVADGVVSANVPKALFLAGSIPVGMATSSSDIDLIVLIDDRTGMSNPETRIVNSDDVLEFSAGTDSLIAGMFLTQTAGILMDLQVAIAPTIRDIQNRLRRRGPELSEIEVRTLSRLATGWLLWQSESYLEHSGVALKDAALEVYCCTKNFVSALIERRKAFTALEMEDVILGLHLGRSSVERAYLAYFASEGFAYLGPKWPALIGYARGAQERVARHPLLKEARGLLFPPYAHTSSAAAQYLREVEDFLAAMRSLIEQKTLFRIAFNACPQIRT